MTVFADTSANALGRISDFLFSNPCPSQNIQMLSFAAMHLSDEEASWIRAQGNSLRVRCFDYGWSLIDEVPGSAAITGSTAIPGR